MCELVAAEVADEAAGIARPNPDYWRADVRDRPCDEPPPAPRPIVRMAARDRDKPAIPRPAGWSIEPARPAESPWPGPPAAGRVRVGLVMPSIYLGGVELWARALARALDPARIVWSGVASAAPDPGDPLARAWLAECGPVRAGPGQAAALAAAVDVLIVWGTDPPPRPRPCKVLLVAHGQGDWTRRRMAAAADADAVAAVSAAARAVIPADQQHRAQVIANAVDFDRLLAPGPDRAATRAAWGVPATAQVALFLGRISSEKRPEAFVEMVAALPPTWWGVLVGQGHVEGPARTAAARLAPDRVVFAGATAAVASAIRAADVGVIPSDQEGGPLVLLEMAALGLPVVAAPVGYAADPVWRDRITITDPRPSGAALARAVRATRADPGLPGRLEAAAAHVRAAHGPAAFGRAWSDLIAGMVPPEPRPRTDAEAVAALTDEQVAAVRDCPERYEVTACCGPRTVCRHNRIRSNATATADCARCFLSGQLVQLGYKKTGV